MKHISSRGPYLSSRKAAESLQIPQLPQHDAPMFIIVFSLAQSNSSFLHGFSSSVFLFLLFDMGNGGAFFGSAVVCSPVVCSPPLFIVWVGAWSFWTGEGRHCTCVGEGHCPVGLHERGCLLVCKRMIDTSQTHPLALIGCVDPRRWILANQITATGRSHRQLTCILFYSQIIMTVLANITKR